MMTAYIPDKKKIHITQNYGDCARFYYIPLIKYFFIKRIKMISHLIKNKEEKVLDIGCGSGILFYELKNKFNILNGLDMREDIVTTAKMLQEDNQKVNLVRGNLFYLPYCDSSFDYVVAMSILEHITYLDQPIKEISRVLKNSGYFICGFPVKNILMHQIFKISGFDDTKDHPSSHRYIYETLKKYFKVEETIKYPFFLAADFCAYMACRCKKL